MKTEKKNNDQHIEDFEEWQDNQYNPGHYLGGKVPGNLLNSGRTKIIGFFLIWIGLMTMIPFVFIVINEFKNDENLLPIEYVLRFIQMLGFAAFSSVMIINGIRKIISGVNKN